MKNKSTSKSTAMQGFTLIELSIVLVIIGLIVGGILVGQDLISAAEIRATVAQVEKYNAAVNTFRTKYNGIPGDLPSAQATAFGLFTDETATAGHADGNGLIEGGASGSVSAYGEVLVFWRQLSDANLLDASLGTTGNSLITSAGAPTGAVTLINQSLPGSKTNPTNYFTVYAVNGLNYYQLGPWSGFSAAGTWTFGTSGLTPIQAYNMDIKLDDGMPLTGAVQAKGIGAMNAAPTNGGGAGHCNVGTGVASDTYNRVAGAGQTDPSCSLQFRFN